LQDPGEVGWVDGHLAATSFVDAVTHMPIVLTDNAKILTSDFEMTFDFSVDNLQLGGPPNANFKHISPLNTDGLLDIWVDTTVDSNASTGDGYTDGVKIATFKVLTGDGGVFTPLTFDGSDDATFELVSTLPGVMLDSSNTDLSTVPGQVLLGITDSNFDGDPTKQGNFSLDAPTNWGSYFTETGAHSAIDFFAHEDGSYRLGLKPIPEPSTIVLLGMGLIGMAVAGRRNISR